MKNKKVNGKKGATSKKQDPAVEVSQATKTSEVSAFDLTLKGLRVLHGEARECSEDSSDLSLKKVEGFESLTVDEVSIFDGVLQELHGEGSRLEQSETFVFSVGEHGKSSSALDKEQEGREDFCVPKVAVVCSLLEDAYKEETYVGMKKEALEKKQLGLNLSRLRRLYGWTQRELSRKVHVNEMTVSRWERGELRCSAVDRFTLCRVLSVSEKMLCAETIGCVERSFEGGSHASEVTVFVLKDVEMLRDVFELSRALCREGYDLSAVRGSYYEEGNVDGGKVFLTLHRGKVFLMVDRSKECKLPSRLQVAHKDVDCGFVDIFSCGFEADPIGVC